MRIPGTTLSDNGPAVPPAEIAFEDFKKADLRLGTVKSAAPVPDADRLLQLQVSFGSFERQIVAGIRKHYHPEDLIGKQFMFVVNLAPRKVRGVESHGMVLAASHESSLSLLTTAFPLPDGTVIG